MVLANAADEDQGCCGSYRKLMVMAMSLRGFGGNIMSLLLIVAQCMIVLMALAVTMIVSMV